MRKTFKAMLLTLILTFALPLSVCADDNYKSYPIGEVDIDVYLPEELVVFTRAVTDSNENLKLIDSTASKLISDMKSGNLYIYAVDKELSYDLTLKVTKSKSSTDLIDRDEEEINKLIKNKTESYKETKNLLFTSADVVSHEDVKFINFKYSLLNEFDTTKTVYVSSYYTIYKGQEVNFQLQTYSKEASLDKEPIFANAMQKTRFVEVEGSTSSDGIVFGALEMLISCVIVIAFVGLILLLVRRSANKKTDNYI
ncbi:MAG: hypothetical protein IJY81_02770 [Lachnospiraceae bacterium]|nr:hypothetical protein [Lachnospiraceae bacterium]